MAESKKSGALVLLEGIEKQPELYLGLTESNSFARLAGLLSGYLWAARQHELGLEHDALCSLFEYLNQETGGDNWNGFRPIRDRCAGDEEAWAMLWELVRRFREQGVWNCAFETTPK